MNSSLHFGFHSMPASTEKVKWKKVLIPNIHFTVLWWLGHDSGLRSFILFKVGSTSNTYDTNIGENKKGFESIVITKIYTRGLGLPIVKKQ